MKTSKPISTISWNTPAYLEKVCRELQASKIISFFCYILHRGEDDEAGKKDHIHLYMEPGRCIQTLDLKELFNEPDLAHKKPLGCLDFHPSKFSDWYWYALHDEAYLKSKCMERKYHYNPDSISRSSPDEMQYRVGTVEPIGSVVVDRIKRLAEAGKSFNEMLVSGAIPAAYVRNYERIYLAFSMIRNKSELQDFSGNAATSTTVRENDDL